MESIIAQAHDEMVDEYDTISDLWYPHLFNQIHNFILASLPNNTEGLKALDVGCGTGFQSFLLAEAGYSVVAFDISTKLLDKAKQKTKKKQHYLFDTPYEHIQHEQSAQIDFALRLRGQRPWMPPSFQYSDAESSSSFPMDQSIDLIVCCGSVLSFLSDWDTFFSRVGASLRPGGRFILEFEQKYNLDLLWPIVDNVLFHKIGYEQTWEEIFRNLFSPFNANIKIDYPFPLSNGVEVNLPITLFSNSYIEKIAASNGFDVMSSASIHSLTNMIPSPVLHKQNPSRFILSVFRLLASCEKKVNHFPLFRSFGASQCYCLIKS